jgi:hypothetical protein
MSLIGYARCDRCGVEEEAPGVLPPEWFQLTFESTTDRRRLMLEMPTFCGLDCLRHWVNAT